MLKKIKIILLLLIILIIVGGIYFSQLVWAPATGSSELVYFEIDSGQSVRQIAENLAEQQLVDSALVFRLYTRLIGAQSNLLAGEHKLAGNMSIKEIVGVLSSGRSVENEKTITIIEGWKIDEIGDYLEKQRLVNKNEFIEATKIINWRDKYDFLRDLPVDTLEGFLFPDTYRIFNDATVDDIISKMLDNFKSKLSSQMIDDAYRDGVSVFELVTLASIVEREAMTKEDKDMVADVFLKRLELNMPLQSDATINYVTGKSELRPSYDDLAVDSRYNTYKYAGLPPGPIANPGLDAIMAVIYPQTNDYYFFLMDKDGVTHYAKTFAEHQDNIRKYLD